MKSYDLLSYSLHYCIYVDHDLLVYFFFDYSPHSYFSRVTALWLSAYIQYKYNSATNPAHRNILLLKPSSLGRAKIAPSPLS